MAVYSCHVASCSSCSWPRWRHYHLPFALHYFLGFHTSCNFCSWVRKSLCFSKFLKTSPNNQVSWKESRRQGADRWERMGTQGRQVVVSIWAFGNLSIQAAVAKRVHEISSRFIIKINQWTKLVSIRVLRRFNFLSLSRCAPLFLKNRFRKCMLVVSF